MMSCAVKRNSRVYRHVHTVTYYRRGDYCRRDMNSIHTLQAPIYYGRYIRFRFDYIPNTEYCQKVLYKFLNVRAILRYSLNVV